MVEVIGWNNRNKFKFWFRVISIYQSTCTNMQADLGFHCSCATLSIISFSSNVAHILCDASLTVSNYRPSNTA